MGPSLRSPRLLGRRLGPVLFPALATLAMTGALASGCQRPPAQAAALPQKAELVEAGPGPADQVVREAMAGARRDGRRLLVYVSATWCQPCQRFQAALRSGALDSYFPDLRLLKFDSDRDQSRLTVAGYDGPYLPRFVLPTPSGRGSGQTISGGTKAEDTAFTSIAPRLQQLLAGHGEPPGSPGG